MNSLIREIRDDMASHGHDWTLPGFRAMAVYRFGVWRMKVRPRWIRAPLSIIYKFCYRRIRNRYGIEVPYTALIGRRVVIEHQHGIVIHGYAQIGDGCRIRQGVTIGNRHLEEPLSAPRIGKNVNIGAGAKILGGIVVGDGVTIGANAVVLRDVPANATVVGVPARVLVKHGEGS